MSTRQLPAWCGTQMNVAVDEAMKWSLKENAGGDMVMLP